MTAFTWDGIRSRVVFGTGSIDQIPTEFDRLGARRVMVVSTPGRAKLVQRVAELAGAAVVARFDRAVVHVPESIAIDARMAAERSSADCLLAIGGGAAIGVAKAVALTSNLPIVAVPTTYSGSEMTPIWGVTANSAKLTGRSPGVLPRVVIYDPLLTMELPAHAAGMSGINAIAHCVEALYAPDSNPVTSLIAEEGIRLLGDALPDVVRIPAEVDTRERAMMGGWLAGTAIGSVQMGLHHKICHILGGSFGLPHAEIHAVMLPFTSAYNRGAAAPAMQITARALGATDAPAALLRLATQLSAPRSLQEIGMHAADIDRAADFAVEEQYPNPRLLTRDGVHALLTAAFEGDTSYVAVSS